MIYTETPGKVPDPGMLVRADLQWNGHDFSDNVPDSSVQIEESPAQIRSRKWSYRRWEHPHMQDYSMDSYQWNTVRSYDPVENSPWYSTVSTADHMLPFRTGLNRASLINARHIIGHMVDGASLPFIPWNLPGNSNQLFRRLATPITRSITIQQDDPFDGDFSLWFLVRDLQELPKLANQLRQLHRTRNIRTERPYNAAAAHLMIQFGILPTLADVRDFMNILIRWASRVEESQKLSERVYTSLMPVKAFTGKDYVEYYYYTLPPSVFCSLGVHITQSTVLHQTTKFYFVMPELTDLLSRIKYWVDKLGLLDPTALWDALPWSFVVDWVIDVSTWIRKTLKPRLLPATLVICDWGESLHSITNYNALIPYPTYSSFTNNTAVWRFGYMSGSAYSLARKRQFPAPLKVSNVTKLMTEKSIITLKRYFLGAALIVSRSKVKPQNQPTDYHRR